MLFPFLGTSMGARGHTLSSPSVAAPLQDDSLDKPRYTGRYFIIFNKREKASDEALRTVARNLQARVAYTSDFGDNPIREELVASADMLVYENLGLALVSEPGPMVEQLQYHKEARFIIEPELVVYPIPMLEAPVISETETALQSTWGIQMIQAHLSSFSGKGVRVAVLDTGLDLVHPDFSGRFIQCKSFVPGTSTAQDGTGHGTHCIGTACGWVDATGTRYGVAHESEIYVGKVLNDEGRGAQAWIIDGMEWAYRSGCKVISMSLGSVVYPGMGYNQAYEAVAAEALANGSIVVAAAGNESRRSLGVYNPVGSPANCPSVLSIGALELRGGSDNHSNLAIADFSNRSINPDQLVDISAPGVNIHSSWPLPTRYRSISGTSMATPHVAGVLALLWEKYPGYDPVQIRQELLKLVQPLGIPQNDAGSGLTRCPIK